VRTLQERRLPAGTLVVDGLGSLRSVLEELY
jgi:hypothetical protein